MPERRSNKSVEVWVKNFAFGEDFYVEVNPVDLVAVVRRGVESGTIKGRLVETEDCVSEHRGHSSMEVFDLDPGTYIVIPVSDGGSET